jgi:hypothetical protein
MERPPTGSREELTGRSSRSPLSRWASPVNTIRVPPCDRAATMTEDAFAQRLR